MNSYPIDYYGSSAANGFSVVAILAITFSCAALGLYPALRRLDAAIQARPIDDDRLDRRFGWAALSRSRLRWYSLVVAGLAIADCAIAALTPALTAGSRAGLYVLAAALSELFVWIWRLITHFARRGWNVWPNAVTLAAMAAGLAALDAIWQLNPLWPPSGRRALAIGAFVAAAYFLAWALDWLSLLQDRYGLPIGSVRMVLPTGAIPPKTLSADVPDRHPPIFYGDAGAQWACLLLAGYAIAMTGFGILFWHGAAWNFHLALYGTMGAALALAAVIQLSLVTHNERVRSIWQRQVNKDTFWLKRLGIIGWTYTTELWWQVAEDEDTTWLRRLAIIAAGTGVVDIAFYGLFHLIGHHDSVAPAPSPTPSLTPTSSPSQPHSGGGGGIVWFGVLLIGGWLWLSWRKRKKGK
jgi:hypothetical protein